MDFAASRPLLSHLLLAVPQDRLSGSTPDDVLPTSRDMKTEAIEIASMVIYSGLTMVYGR